MINRVRDVAATILLTAILVTVLLWLEWRELAALVGAGGVLGVAYLGWTQRD